MHITELLAILRSKGEVVFKGDENTSIESVVRLADLNAADAISWCNSKNLEKLPGIGAGTIIAPIEATNFPFQTGVNYILTPDPRGAFREVLLYFSKKKSQPDGIAGTAQIHPSAKIGKGVYIGHHVVIAANCVIGDMVRIGSNTVILEDCVIGNRVVIGANNTIGGVGFGYEQNEADGGSYELMPHLGNVVLEDDVEIGNNTCIDRAVIGSTILRRNVKVDNLVHIAHGVEIGANSLIIANSMIAGSTVIGENCWIAPSVSIKNGMVIGHHVSSGIGSVIVSNIESNKSVVGVPAVEMAEFLAQRKFLKERK
ncbi:MAG: hypothetical protein U0T73_11785 [Chitinophagales bacterium]